MLFALRSLRYGALGGNRMKSMKNALYSLVALSMMGLHPHPVLADPTPDQIKTALDAAEAHVRTQKAKHEIRVTHVLSPAASALGLAIPPTPAPYKTGDQWDVVSYQELPLNASSKILHSGRSAAFHYQVSSVDDQSIRIRVTPIAAYGLKNIDPKVQFADFVYSKDLKLTAKYYKISGYPDPISLSPDNFKVGVSVMEGFPLELPEITDAEKDSTFNYSPEFTATYNSAIASAGYSGLSVMEPCWTTWDFFGRHIQSIWPSGQPFPTLMKTTQGYSVLARQEVR
jgi:hypothetical protein